MQWYLTVLKKYATFDGRARRKEYWMFFLFQAIVLFALGFLSGVMGMADEGVGSPLLALYYLGTLLPTIAAGVRRMHDVGRSGWWLIVPIANLVFSVTEGERGPNRFGADPKESERSQFLAGVS